jgi:uncharacterized DUF497 family protein
VEYSWDERKNRANRKKHGVSFEMASLVFDDPLHISVQDREVDGEARWQTIGMIETSTCWSLLTRCMLTWWMRTRS